MTAMGHKQTDCDHLRSSALPLKADMRALASTKASGPEFLDLVRFDLGAPVSGPQRWLYLAGIEQVHPSGRSGDDQHGLGTCRLESVDLNIAEMVVGTSAGSYAGSSLTSGHFQRLRLEFDFFGHFPTLFARLAPVASPNLSQKRAQEITSASRTAAQPQSARSATRRLPPTTG